MGMDALDAIEFYFDRRLRDVFSLKKGTILSTNGEYLSKCDETFEILFTKIR